MVIIELAVRDKTGRQSWPISLCWHPKPWSADPVSRTGSKANQVSNDIAMYVYTMYVRVYTVCITYTSAWDKPLRRMRTGKAHSLDAL